MIAALRILGLSGGKGLAKAICVRSASSSSTPNMPLGESTSGQPQQLFAACVLERLPIVMQPPAPWEVEHALWRRSEDLRLGFAKAYPSSQGKGEGPEKAASQTVQALRTFDAVPSVTRDDKENNWRSMRRQLHERLYLLVKRGPQPEAPSEGKEAGAAPQATWRFPAVQHQAGESIRQAGERALSNIIGRVHPIFFVGNAPMGHLPSIPSGSSSFFLLAQVVGDPWECQLKGDSGCEDWAWVTKDELPKFLNDPRVKELTSRML